MAGGSVEAEGPHDKECPHCGLYYRDQGVSFTMHEASCDGDGEATEDDVEGASDDASGSGGLGMDSVTDEQESHSESTETDVSDNDDDEETEDCPHCGEDTGLTTEQGVREGPYWQCTECGGQFEVTEE